MSSQEKYIPTEEELVEFMNQFEELERQLQIEKDKKDKLSKLLKKNPLIRQQNKEYYQEISELRETNNKEMGNKKRAFKKIENLELQLEQALRDKKNINSLNIQIERQNRTYVKQLETAKSFGIELGIINDNVSNENRQLLEELEKKNFVIKKIRGDLEQQRLVSENISEYQGKENNCDELNKQIRKLTLEKESKVQEVKELKELLDSERDRVSELTSRIKEMEDEDVQSKIEIRDSHRQNEIITNILNNQIQFMLELVNNISRLNLKQSDSIKLEEKIRKNLRIIQEKIVKSRSKLGGMKKRKKKRKRRRKTRRKSKIKKKRTKRK